MSVNRVLFISNLSGNISFSEVSLEILKLLKQNINPQKTDFYIFSIGSIRKFMKYNVPKELGIPKEKVFVINEIKNLNNNPFNLEYYKNCIDGYNTIREIVKAIQPNIIFIFNDNMAVNKMTTAIENIKPKYNGKIITYIPIDLGNFDEKTINTNCDLIFVPTDFTKDILMKYEKDIPIVRLPHFIPSSIFHKIEDKDKISEIREKYFGKENVDKFVIGALNANSIRKRWDLLLEAYCKYYLKQQQSNGPLLFIKTTKLKGNNPAHGHGRGFDLDELIEQTLTRYNVPKEAVVITPEKYSQVELNEIYNACDLFVNTTDGEGFGMTPFEAGLAEKVTILPNYSAFESIFEKFEPNDEYQPEFLLPVNLYSAKLIRDNNDISQILRGNQYYCVYYSCKHYKQSRIFMDNGFLPLSKNIKTIYISEAGSDVDVVKINPVNECDLFIHLRTFKKALDLIKNLSRERKLPDEFQILVSCSPSVIDEVYETMCIFESKSREKSFDRKIFVSNKELIRDYGVKYTPHVGLIQPDDLVEKIDFYQKNRDVLEEDGKKMSKFVRQELSEDIFYEIFTRSLGQLNIYL